MLYLTGALFYYLFQIFMTSSITFLLVMSYHFLLILLVLFKNTSHDSAYVHKELFIEFVFDMSPNLKYHILSVILKDV